MDSEATSILKKDKGDATDFCKETVDTAGAQNVTEHNINTAGEEVAVNNMNNAENVYKQRNDVNQSRQNRRRKKLRCNNKKKNETSAKEADPSEKGKQKNIPNQKISDQDQHDQENLVKTNPRKDLESLPENKRNYPEKVLYRGRGGTNSDNQGRGYTRDINRGRGQAFHPCINRGSKYVGNRGRGGSDFNRGRGISDSNGRQGKPGYNRGRGTSDFNIGRERPNFNQGRGRSEFSRNSERKEFNRGSGRPYFNRSRGRGSEVYGGSASWATINTEFKGDSCNTKVNNFTNRGRSNGEFNRGRANSYSKNVDREFEGERRSYNRGGSHTGNVRNFLVRGRGTREFNRGRGRQDFQRGRGSSYYRIEEE